MIMATRFYLTRLPAATPKPTSKQSSDTVFSDCATVYATTLNPCLLSVTQGTIPTLNYGIDWEPGAPHYNRFGTWVSDPLPAQTLSGTVTLGLCMNEIAANYNRFARIKVYLWKANNSFGSDILALTDSTTECEVSATPMELTNTVYFSAVPITTTQIQNGDKICIEVECYDNNALESPRPHNFQFGGGATVEDPDAYVLADHGIIANGSDETDEIAACFAEAVGLGKTKISFPLNGIIGITDRIDFPGGLEWIGNSCTIKLVDNADLIEDDALLTIGATSNVHNMIFDGNMDNQPNDKNGVALYEDTTFAYNEVKNIAEYSLGSYGRANVIYDHNTVHDSLQYGISLAGEEGMLSEDCEITNNTIYNCGQVGIKLHHTDGVVITGNVIDLPSDTSEPTGIRLYSADGPNNMILIDSNTIHGAGAYADVGVYSDNEDNTNITITNNTIHTVDIGVTLNFDDATVTGNDITYYSECIQDNGSGNTTTPNTCSEA